MILTSLVLVSGIVAGHESLAVFGISGFLVVAAAMLDMNVRHGNRIITALGQSSYSIYLIHVPLQMTILLAADLFFAGTRAFALSHVTLPLFLTASLLLALICYHKLEKPAGRALRRILGGGNPT